MFNVFINVSDDKMECNLSKFVNKTKLTLVVSTPEGRAPSQRNPDRLERWTGKPLIKFNMTANPASAME